MIPAIQKQQMSCILLLSEMANILNSVILSILEHKTIRCRGPSQSILKPESSYLLMLSELPDTLMS